MMRLGFAFLVVSGVLAPLTQAQPGVEVYPIPFVFSDEHPLVVVNRGETSVTFDSLRITSMLNPANSGVGWGMWYTIHAEGEEASDSVECLDDECVDGYPALLGHGIAPGDSISFRDFKVTCRCRPADAPDEMWIEDTLWIYTDGRIEPIEVPMSGAVVTVEPGPGEAGLQVWVYPNPARSLRGVFVSLATAADVEVVLFDALGRRLALIHQGPLSAGEHHLSTSHPALAAGLYVVSATVDGRVASRTVTVVPY